MTPEKAERIFLQEMKGFLFYSRFVWPWHRKLCRSLITPRCHRCVISAQLSSLNSAGLCSQCVALSQSDIQTHPPSQAQALSAPQLRALAETDSSQVQAQELDNILTSTGGKGSGRFDAVVLFSGGKDSVYLVNHLTKVYPKLRLVLLTIDNTFMSPFAKKNIDYTISKINCELVSVRPPAALMEKMFRHTFLNLNAKGCSGTVDQLDGDLLHDIGRNFAKDHRIPLLISGCSRTQVEQILGLQHFESPQEVEINPRRSLAQIPLEDMCNEDEIKIWWRGGDPGEIPRVIFPFYVYNFSESEILEAVERLGLLPPFSKSPLLTNNQLIPLMAIVDMVKFGYSSFESEFCKMARVGKTDALFWRNIFELSEYSAKTGRFISKSVDVSLARLGLTRKSMGIPE
jgi:hypothetical protein